MTAGPPHPTFDPNAGQSMPPAPPPPAPPQPWQNYPPQNYPQPMPPLWLPLAPLPVLPVRPAEYHQVLTGPRARWWKPIASGALTAVLWMGAMAVVSVSLILAGVAGGASLNDPLALDMGNPLTFAGTNLMLAAAIPATVLGTWAVHRVRPSFVGSVLGRIRWRWMGRCALVLTPLWIAYLAATFFIPVPSGPDAPASTEFVLDPQPHWPILIALTLLTTPLQSAGEEVFFRGWIMQNVGVWIRQPRIALAVSSVLSAVLFSLAHGSLDPWLLLDLMVFAVAMTLMTWRTGGLEAAIVLHAVNNVIGIGLSIALGQLSSAFIDTDSASTPLQTSVSAVALAVATAVVWRMADRHRIARVTEPAT